MMEGRILRVNLVEGHDGYIVAECLELPGCMSQGSTEKEAMENIEKAINLCLDVMLEDFLKKSQRKAKPSNREIQFRISAPRLHAVA